MPIPNWFVNGPRRNNPPGGEVLCILDPPFTQHMTLEVLCHCALAGCELQHRDSENRIKQILICTNRDTIYLTVEPGDKLQMNWIASGAGDMVQGSLYAWR